MNVGINGQQIIYRHKFGIRPNEQKKKTNSIHS